MRSRWHQRLPHRELDFSVSWPRFSTIAFLSTVGAKTPSLANGRAACGSEFMKTRQAELDFWAVRAQRAVIQRIGLVPKRTMIARTTSSKVTDPRRLHGNRFARRRMNHFVVGSEGAGKYSMKVFAGRHSECGTRHQSDRHSLHRSAAPAFVFAAASQFSSAHDVRGNSALLRATSRYRILPLRSRH